MGNKIIEKREDTENEKKTGFWGTLWYVHKTACGADKKRYYLFLILSLVTSLQIFVYLTSTEQVVNSVYSLALGETEWGSAAALIIGFGLLEGFFMLLGLLKDRLEVRFDYALDYHLKDELNGRLAGMKMEYFETHESMVRIHDVKSRMGEIFPKYVRSIVVYLMAVPLLVVYGYFLSRVNPWYVLVYFVLFLVFNVFVNRKFSGIWSCWDELQKYDQKRQYYFGLCGDKISHQEYKANGLFGYFTGIWEGAFQECHRERMKIHRKFEGRLQLSRILFNIPYIVMLVLLSFEVMDGRQQIGFLIMANSLLNGILDTYFTLQRNVMDNRVDSRTVTNYRKILACEDFERTDYVYQKGDIRVEIPGFSYPQSGQTALKALDLTIKEGEKIMIVGENGSGKTTFVSILVSLLAGEGGVVSVSGKKAGLNSSTACIFQDFYQYQTTVRENIEMGDPGRKLTDEEIWELLDTVGLREKVEGLEQGLDTRLGQLDGQGDFSKGQWQRIAIARLLAKKDAGIWILDEPTAYLDPLSEIEVYNMIYRLAGDRIVIFISHRLGFARQTDRILVFRKGEIAEQGSHGELMEKENGIYREMYSLQKEWYQ